MLAFCCEEVRVFFYSSQHIKKGTGETAKSPRAHHFGSTLFKMGPALSRIFSIYLFPPTPVFHVEANPGVYLLPKYSVSLITGKDYTLLIFSLYSDHFLKVLSPPYPLPLTIGSCCSPGWFRTLIRPGMTLSV